MEDGKTLRQTYGDTLKFYGYKHPRLEEPELPFHVMDLWNAFWKMNMRDRKRGHFGEQMLLQSGTIDAYSKRYGFEPWEVQAIEAMDVALLIAQAENNKNG
jgi:hypothetical protein